MLYYIILYYIILYYIILYYIILYYIILYHINCRFSLVVVIRLLTLRLWIYLKAGSPASLSIGSLIIRCFSNRNTLLSFPFAFDLPSATTKLFCAVQTS